MVGAAPGRPTGLPAHAAANLRRYARIAPVYDLLDRAFERHYRAGRVQIGSRASGLVVEVGAGTGKNFSHYGGAARVFASDLSPAMLGRAGARLTGPVRGLFVGEAAALPVRDGAADTIVATFVCCVQDDPRPALDEFRRTLRPGGRLLSMDYTLPRHRGLRWLMRLVEAPLRWLYGIRWDHDAPRLLDAAGFRVRDVLSVWGSVVRVLVADTLPGEIHGGEQYEHLPTAHPTPDHRLGDEESGGDRRAASVAPASRGSRP